MGDEIDRRLFPGFLQTTFAISLGGAYRMAEMRKRQARVAQHG